MIPNLRRAPASVKNRSSRAGAAILWALILAGTGQSAAALDLRTAQVLADSNLTGPETKAVEMLIAEVEERTGITWTREGSPATAGPAIAIHHAAAMGPAEGFQLRVAADGVSIQGYDERGTLFGVGRLLRELRWSKGMVSVPDQTDISSSPKYAIRGQQIGYRPKVNTYDAWTPKDFERYVRDLAVFGVNAIELIPPRSDDQDQSPHFHLPKLEMMIEMSRIISEYGLQVWVWYPALGKGYDNPKTVEAALLEWGNVFSRLPRIDAIMVPGGDPGSTPPIDLMHLLEQEARVLRRYHPKAQVWVSPQAFNEQRMGQFLEIMKTNPDWLTGVAFGPGTRLPVPELRKKLPARYPIRLYPDITHSILCEYPVPDWDVAFAATEARETINPRPRDEAAIFHYAAPSSVGFSTYSEGVNDDVNKIVWSGLGWNPDQPVETILREYARYFIDPKFETQFVAGLLSLERNWRGPLLSNPGIETTFLQFQEMENQATPQMLRNWRFLQALYRAYYDAYVRARLINETALQQRATFALRAAPQVGSMAAMAEAEQILDEAVRRPVATEVRTRIFALAEALYQTIGMQLSVKLYQAEGVGRGANLDTVDFPLNDRFWLEKELSAVRTGDTEKRRLTQIDALLNRANPGPGGFYDDLGNNALEPHLVQRGPGFAQDPGGFESVRAEIRPEGLAKLLDTPMAWWNYAETRQEKPLVMHYDGLDPEARYIVRVVYAGFATEPKVRLEAGNGVEIHPYLKRPAIVSPLDFDLPPAAIENGGLTLKWSLEPGHAGFDAYVSVSEVMVIRKEVKRP